MKKLSFAVIGGGPAGFYIAKCLAKLQQQPAIHIYEKQYCPFGLLRYGVAPDHITIKKSQNTLSSISQYANFKYFGNMNINQKLISSLKDSYSGIIYAIGAQKNNVPSWMPERGPSFSFTSATALNARDLVYWYNNHPQYQKVKLDFTNKRDVLIIGNGNVAIDISRILLKTTNLLEGTQISLNALESLKTSKVRNVILVARRGFTHSAFSVKEIRQITSANISIYCIEQELQASFNKASHLECTETWNQHAAVVRMNKRKIDFVRNKCTIIKRNQLGSILQDNKRKVILRYLLDPLQISQGSFIFSVNKLKGEAFAQTSQKTDQKEAIKFDLLVNSTGFKVQPIRSEHLNKVTNFIDNSHGCVLGRQSDKIQKGEYTVGWSKSGPKGIIDQTLLGCEQTYNNIRIHARNGFLQQKRIPAAQFANHHYSYQKYQKLKQLELNAGNKEKFIKKKLSFSQVEQFFNK